MLRTVLAPTIRGAVAERQETGVLDTCTYIDLGLLDPAAVPRFRNPPLSPLLKCIRSDGEGHRGSRVLTSLVAPSSPRCRSSVMRPPGTERWSHWFLRRIGICGLGAWFSWSHRGAANFSAVEICALDLLP